MSDQTPTCPICAFDGDSEREIYSHVLNSHRKRTIADVLFDARSPSQPDR